MADIDAALVQQVRHIPQRQRKANIQQDCEADDFGTAVKALEWVCFSREDRLRNRPALLNSNPSDKTVRRPHSHCWRTQTNEHQRTAAMELRRARVNGATVSSPI